MKPTEILDAIIYLEHEICDISEKMAPLRSRLEVLTFMRSDVRALLNNGAPWEKVAERMSDFAAGIVPDAIEEVGPTRPDDAPYGRRADGTPKARPGRKAKEAPAVNLSPGETEPAKAPVDEAKNAADIRVIRSALEGGPLTIDELVMNSGVSHPDVMRHLAAGAVIEEYTAARGEGLEPLPLVRLISQRTS
jgi:DNA-binding transcriptional ArsR family regulator